MTDDELLSAAARGDGDAFAVFYRRHVDVVVAFFQRRVRQPELAFDLTAETFAAALQATRRYRKGEGAAVAWLLGIAHEVGRIEGARFTPASMEWPQGDREAKVMICGSGLADGMLVRGGVSRLSREGLWLRFGMLGPRATQARYITDDGKSLEQAVSDGGGYLFVREELPARPTKEHVDGVFADGRVITVAGHHASPQPLPGTAVYPLPRNTCAKVRLLTIRKLPTVRFKSPVAMTRSDEVFRAYVDPPPGCRRGIPGYQQATNRDYARGDRVEIPIGTDPACHGTFKVTVRYHSQRTGNKGELRVGAVRLTR